MTDLAPLIHTGKRYTLIVLIASFHHLESRAERVATLMDLKQLLTPDGTLYLTNWNLRDQERYQSSHRGNGDFSIKIGAHFRYYHGFTLSELHELYTITGWDIRENRIFSGGRNIYSKLKLL
jgi:hypothetical protein